MGFRVKTKEILPLFGIIYLNDKNILKTYLDEGNEEIAPRDWSALHLDAIGKKEGF